MKRNHLLYFIIILPALLSFSWPLKNGRITSSFGEARADHIHDGMDMTSSEFRVYPVDKGDLLYMWDKSIFPFDEYSGSGNYKIVEHDNGYLSTYLHLADGMSAALNCPLEESIAKYASTGRSFGNHIHFGLISRKDFSSINPITVMPKVDDKIPPIVQEIAFSIDNKITIIKDKAKIRLTKNHPLLVKVVDSIQKNDRLGIFELIIDFNGENVLNQKFDILKYDKKKLTISDYLFDDLYDGAGYYKIKNTKWKQGPNVIEIKATDFSGNIAIKNYTLEANLEY